MPLARLKRVSRLKSSPAINENPRLTPGAPWKCRDLAAWLVFLFVFLRFLGVLLFRFLGAFRLLGFQIASQKLNNRDVGAIALSVPQLYNPAVPALAIGKLRCDRIEDFLRDRIFEQIAVDHAARLQVIALAQGDHLLGQRADFLRLRQGRHEAAVFEKRRHQVPQQRSPVRRVPAEFTSFVSVSHTYYSIYSAGYSAGEAPATGRPCSSSRIPRASPIPPRISLISFRDFRPKFLVFSISASVLMTSSPIVRILAFFRQL